MTEKPPAAPAPAKPTTADQSELATLRAENASLRAQLAATGRIRPTAQHQFVLSEGQRQELVATGVTTVDGVRRTADQIQEMLGDDQRGVDLGDAEPVDTGEGDQPKRAPIRGFDYVYPSVEPGFIDPAVAGTPGINGPSADDKR